MTKSKLLLSLLSFILLFHIFHSTSELTSMSSKFINAERIPNEYKVNIRFNPHTKSNNGFEVNSLIHCINAMVMTCMDQCNAISYVYNICQFGTIALNGSLISSHVSQDFSELFDF